MAEVLDPRLGRAKETVKPVRLTVSRQRGFDLKHLSRLENGLPAVLVSRPGKWGNPFKVTVEFEPGTAIGVRLIAVTSAEEGVRRYRAMLEQQPALAAKVRAELAGKNLACWCKAGTPCHADVLLEVANTASPRTGQAGDPS